jgi:transposase
MKERKKYTEQFKSDAVALVLSGRSPRAVARDLGICVSSLNRWRKSHLIDQDNNYSGSGQSPSEMADEIRRLRRELAEQKDIVTILKKTIKYVS